VLPVFLAGLRNCLMERWSYSARKAPSGSSFIARRAGR
jgi:hypothetical protein